MSMQKPKVEFPSAIFVITFLIAAFEAITDVNKKI
jgi:hypothetical protein